MKVTWRIRNLHETERPNYERLSKDVVAKLDGFCDERGWFLRHRIKELESFALKLETGRVERLDRLEDFFACTIIVPTLVAVSEAEELVCAAYPLQERRPREIEMTHKSASDFVFDDLRLYLARGDDETGMNTDLADYVFEVQIKTILQYAWGIATHDLIYKSDSISWPKERVAYQVKAMLEHAELAITEVATLAGAAAMARTNQKTADLQQLMIDLREIWTPDRLPKDLRRLAETIFNLLKVCKLKVRHFRPLLQAEMRRCGTLSLDLSPYSFTLQAIAHSADVQFEQKLLAAERQFRVIVHDGIELPNWMTVEHARIVRL
jgi:hypothetical protein